MINQIVDYCSSQVNFISSNYGDKRCNKCNNDCSGGCEKCLDDIHFKRKIRRYNCQNIVNFYVCKYIFKYASEIEYILNKVDYLDLFDRLDILSIGCGPSTDLFGIINFLNNKGDKREIKYAGCDLNLYWKSIHNYIQSIVKNGQRTIVTKYIYHDIFQIIKRLNLNSPSRWIPNILILQYVISDMLMFSEDINSFFDDLILNIYNYMPNNSIIIINDINLGRKSSEPRYYYDILEKKIKPKIVYKYHFKNNCRQYFYPYGKAHQKNKVLYEIPDNILNFNPWDTCSSAQIILQKG